MSFGIVTLLVIDWEPQTRCFRSNRDKKTRKCEKSDILFHLLYVIYVMYFFLFVPLSISVLKSLKFHFHVCFWFCLHISRHERSKLTNWIVKLSNADQPHSQNRCCPIYVLLTDVTHMPNVKM